MLLESVNFQGFIVACLNYIQQPAQATIATIEQVQEQVCKHVWLLC